MCKCVLVVYSFTRHYVAEQLQQGTNLVVDRYAYSGVAFSAAKKVSIAMVIYV